MCIWAGLQSIAGIGICLRTCARAAESCHPTGRVSPPCQSGGCLQPCNPGSRFEPLCVGEVHCRFLSDLEGSCSSHGIYGHYGGARVRH